MSLFQTARGSVGIRIPRYWKNTLSETILHLATALAAFFQAVTGVGFGMIAGPVVLVVLDDPAAVVVSSLMSWLIAIVLFPSLFRGTDLGLLKRYVTGAVIGLPVGLAILTFSSVAMLKLLAGLSIGGLTAMMLFGAPGMRSPGPRGDLGFSALGGFFGACLAMPGPTVAIRMTGLGYDKQTIRATMVSYFVATWPLIVLGQWATAGVTSETLVNALSLVPATLCGLLLGNYAASRVSEAFFRRMVIGFLILTSVSLLGNVIWTETGAGL